ncbi:MAG: anaerobic ribonucleoside-triphosphate reductase activating protein [Planctomycetia bacterium]|nr:anaerobic ribonucleoside-triphosphate reductase activating protein [Planctomycetia bacterium]
MNHFTAEENAENSGFLRVAGTIRESVADGPGIRYVIFVQGCPRRCSGCHNPQTQCLNGGYLKSVEEILSEIRENPLLSGVTFSGGEPFLQARKLVPIARECHAMGLNIMTYTGWTFEELLDAHNPDWNKLIAESDVIVDGPYQEELRSLQTRFRGSSNQRLVDVAMSLLEHSVQTL